MDGRSPRSLYYHRCNYSRPIRYISNIITLYSSTVNQASRLSSCLLPHLPQDCAMSWAFRIPLKKLRSERRSYRKPASDTRTKILTETQLQSSKSSKPSTRHGTKRKEHNKLRRRFIAQMIAHASNNHPILHHRDMHRRLMVHTAKSRLRISTIIVHRDTHDHMMVHATKGHSIRRHRDTHGHLMVRAVESRPRLTTKHVHHQMIVIRVLVHATGNRLILSNEPPHQLPTRRHEISN